MTKIATAEEVDFMRKTAKLQERGIQSGTGFTPYAVLCLIAAYDEQKARADMLQSSLETHRGYASTLLEALSLRIHTLADTIRSLVGLCRGAWPEAPDRDIVDRALEVLGDD